MDIFHFAVLKCGLAVSLVPCVWHGESNRGPVPPRNAKPQHTTHCYILQQFGVLGERCRAATFTGVHTNSISRRTSTDAHQHAISPGYVLFIVVLIASGSKLRSFTGAPHRRTRRMYIDTRLTISQPRLLFISALVMSSTRQNTNFEVIMLRLPFLPRGCCADEL